MPSSRVLGDATFCHVRPDVDDLVVALAVRDQTFLVLLDRSVGDCSFCAVSISVVSFDAGMTMSSMQIEMPARVD